MVIDPTMIGILGGTSLFLAAVMLLAYVPGRLVLHLLNSRRTPLDEAVLSLVLGLVISAWLYGVTMWAGIGRLFFLWPLFAGILFLFTRARYRRLPAADPSPTGAAHDRSHILLACVVTLGIVMLAILPIYYSNLTLTGSGEMRVARLDDVFWHLAISNELTHDVPPQNPVAAGFPLDYHYGMDLAVAMFAVVTDLSTADLFLRYLSSLFLVVAMLVVYCAARSWLKSGYFAALTAFLVFFGEDFSFLPGLSLFFSHPDSTANDWSTQFFGVPAVFSLFYNNPILPAVGILFAGIYCLRTGLVEGARAWLCVSALLFGTLMDVKMFAGAQMLAALLMTSLLYLYRFRDTRLLWVIVPVLAYAVPALVADVELGRQGADFHVNFDPWSKLSASMVAVGLKNLTDPADLVFLGLPVFLAGSLGLRIIAIPRIVRGIVRPSPENPLHMVLGLFIVIGIGAGLIFRFVPSHLPDAYDNSVWFYAQSKYVIWPFAIEVIRDWCHKRIERGSGTMKTGVAIAAAAIALSIPSTVQHFVLMLRQKNILFDRNVIAATDFLARDASPGDILLGDQRVVDAAMAWTTCHVPLGPFAEYAIPYGEVQRRKHLEDEFWSDWQHGHLRADLLLALRIRYLVLPTAGAALPTISAPGIEQVYSDAEFVVLKLDRPVGGKRATGKDERTANSFATFRPST
ncbi:MAG: hypothetical protein P4L83_12895 [Nevskia sp.]|nr:hypothetical protein [Nevskia sp.]